MTRIVDGEIIRDDGQVPGGAPRQTYQTPLRPPGQPGPQPSSTPFLPFNWAAPPLQTVPEPGGLLGLPSVELYGARLPSRGLLGLAAATLFLGWRGALAGLALWLAYGCNWARLSSTAPAPQTQQGGIVGVAASFFRTLIPTPPAAGAQAPPAVSDSMPGPRAYDGGAGVSSKADGWQGLGKGHRLGSA